MEADQAAMASSEKTVWTEQEPSFSIFGSDFIERAEELTTECPVTRFAGGGILATGLSAVDYIMHNPAAFSSRPDAVFLGSEGGLIPIQVDPPEHTRYRKLLNEPFSPLKIEQIEESVSGLVNRCIDSVADQGSADLVADIGSPVAGGTILALLGFPLENLPELLTIKDDILRGGEGVAASEREKQAAEAGMRAYAFFGGVLDAKQDNPGGDMASHLVALEAEGKLTRKESLDVCLLLVIAGLDTVTTATANMFYLLASRPDLRQRIVDGPSIIPAAVEEFLRVIAPIPTTPRVTVADVEVDGCPIKKGEKLSVMFSTMNWDEKVYEQPKEIRFDRPVNRHVSFGVGLHRCLGSHLARMELQVILREWHKRIPDYSLPAGYTAQWRRGIREMPSMPVVFPT